MKYSKKGYYIRAKYGLYHFNGKKWCFLSSPDGDIETSFGDGDLDSEELYFLSTQFVDALKKIEKAKDVNDEERIKEIIRATL